MNSYLPKLAVIEKVKKETKDVKTFWFKTEEEIEFVPGQVIMVSVFGFGESTFGIIPTENRGVYEFSAKKVGTVTNKLFKMGRGDWIGIRGPFGNGYPVEKMEGKNVIIIGGGIGIPPLKSLLLHILKNREKYRDVEIYYGARTPEDIVYRKEFEDWMKKKDLKVEVTVDKGNKKWKGNTGVVTTLLENLEVKNSIICACGPPVMLKFVTMKLLEIGAKKENIYISMERLMKCGVGMCGHCNIGKFYVCKHGPVFTLKKLEESSEKVW